MQIVSWIKNNKLAALLFIILLYLVGKNWFAGSVLRETSYTSMESALPGIGGGDMSASLKMGRGGIMPPAPDYAPAPEVADRKVIRESDVSLQVKDVRQSADTIISQASKIGGYMVNSFFNNPSEAPSATVTVRVPATKLQDFLSFLRSHGVKVVSESLSGQDVTDQYVDIDARIATLVQTKTKFEQILAQATEVSDILTVNREIINIQSQIDSYKGQQQYLDKSAQSSRVTIYLSTDAFSLPYAPSETWRPEVIFKQAVRSLVSNLRKAGTALIWLVVYGVVAVPIFLIGRIIFRRLSR